jgi:hypothetical protein
VQYNCSSTEVDCSYSAITASKISQSTAVTALLLQFQNGNIFYEGPTRCATLWKVTWVPDAATPALMLSAILSCSLQSITHLYPKNDLSLPHNEMSMFSCVQQEEKKHFHKFNMRAETYCTICRFILVARNVALVLVCVFPVALFLFVLETRTQVLCI